MKKYEVFLIDADGTLFDYDMAEESALKIMFRKYQFSYEENVRIKYSVASYSKLGTVLVLPGNIRYNKANSLLPEG